MSPDWIIAVDQPVLVTGAGGFVGRRVVRMLLDYGFRNIRCFVRSSSTIGPLKDVLASHPSAASSLSIIEGNLLSREDCARATAGAAVVFHPAAGIEKSFAGCFMNSVLTTRNLLDGAMASGSLKRFVNVSSFAVYSNQAMRRGALLDEQTPVEPDPTRQDAYGYAKLKQEKIVEQYHRDFGVPFVTVRPGAVYGPGKASLSGRIGINTFGVYLHLGGSNPIPLTYVDNCAEAIVRAGIVPGIDGQVFNIVDDDLPTSRQFLGMYKRHALRFRSIPVPYPMTYLLCALWENYSKWSEGQLPPTFNRRRCSAEWKGNRYTNRKLKERLGWTPRVPFAQASRLFFESVREGAR